MADAFIVNRNALKDISTLKVRGGGGDTTYYYGETLTFDISDINKYDIQCIVIWMCQTYQNQRPKFTVFKPNGELIGFDIGVTIKIADGILTVSQTAYPNNEYFLRVGIIC